MIGLGGWVGSPGGGEEHFQVEASAERQWWETTEQVQGTVSIFLAGAEAAWG